LLEFPIQGLYGSLILPLAYPIDRIRQHEAEDAITPLLAVMAGTEAGVEMLREQMKFVKIVAEVNKRFRDYWL
jgi:hypothetical protein